MNIIKKINNIFSNLINSVKEDISKENNDR